MSDYLIEQQEEPKQIFECKKCGVKAEFIHYGDAEELAEVRKQMQVQHSRFFHT